MGEKKQEITDKFTIKKFTAFAKNSKTFTVTNREKQV